jgi:sugar lactone lactonase YvrE
VLATDSAQGLLYRIDTRTGAYTIALNVSETQFLPTAASSPGGLTSAFAANGIKVQKGYVYWSNSNRLAIYRLALDARGYLAAGAPVELVATIPTATFVDDFTFDARGGIWAATNFDNDIYTIDEHRTPQVEVAVGGVGELTVPGDSSVAFGRTAADHHILYASTFGGAAVPINGSIVVPGGIVAIDTRGHLY